jgi:DNA-binding NtrC family response regulator
MSELQILILDDEARIREEVREFLEDSGFKVYEAGDYSEALAVLEDVAIDICIVDLNLPGKHGLEVLEEIKGLYPDIEVLIITGQGTMETAIKAMRLGAADFFNKPVPMRDVMIAIQKSCRFVYLNRQIKSIRTSYDRVIGELMEHMGVEFIGSSPQSQKIMQDIRLVAKNPDTSVMICGESGTGKELVARSIHLLSSRSQNYFNAVNCAAIPDNLFESEFFGYEKGAFTGAVSSKAGWFETAHNGTIFLDEIGDMNALMQAKLLRITEDGRVRRIGSNRDREVNVRIITATNRDIEALIRDGQFRADLYHRLNTFQIKIPPLRERKQDIDDLICYYLEYFAKKTGKAISGVEAAALDKLRAYHYPGNIRELKNMMERAVILCNNKHLGVRHFRAELFCDESPCCGDESEILDLQKLEQTAIERAMIKTGNNKVQAAKLLNISWQALDRRLRKS